MKFLYLTMAMLAVASATEKRFLLDSLHFENLLGLLGHNELTNYVNQIVDLVGSDATEQQCETACLEVMHSDLLDTACPLICTSFQALVQKLHIDATQAPAKRFLLDSLHFENLLGLLGHNELTNYVNQIVDLVGSDATEQQCETACLEVMHSDHLDTACPLICTSFQALVQKLHIDATQAPAKRFLLDSLNFGNLLSLMGNDDLNKYVNQIVELVGSDATEQQCETACLEVMHSDLLDTACPLICTSFQSLVQKFHVDTNGGVHGPAKRFLLDSLHFENLLGLLGHNELSNYVNQIVDLVGSDATEQQCETACLEVIHSDLLDTACPLICTSFQALVQKLHIDATQAPAKRFLLDSLNFGNLLSLMGNDDLNKYVNQIVELVGSDATEQQCETACLEVMHSDLLDTACPLICTSFQSLVQKFHVDTNGGVHGPAKRFLLDSLHFENLLGLLGHNELSNYVNQIVDLVGSDATEQQCETACLEVIHSDLLDTACPLICTSFQALVQKLHIDATQAPAKRFLLDSLNFGNLLSLMGNDDLNKYVNQIVELVGSDATEQQCETACLEVMHSDLLDTACPLICTSFQSLVQKFHVDTNGGVHGPAKRFLLDSLHFENLLGLLGHNELSNYVNQIVDLVGSDATEQQCETACLEVIHSDLLDTACPLICTSFQALVQKLHIDATQAPAKRFLLDSLNFGNLLSLMGNDDLNKYVNQIVELVGSDATEQQCETACLEVMHSDLLDTACPLICTSFQSLVQKFHVDTNGGVHGPAKRFLLDSLHFENLLGLLGHNELSNYVNQIVDLVGSDATEQQCETACLEVIHSDLLDTACPLICTSFQALVQKLHIDATQAPAKRFLLDSLNFGNLLSLMGNDDLNKYVNQIVELVGSDATEQQCETACLEVMHSDLLDTACPLICTSFQSLVQKFHVDTNGGVHGPAKRFLLDSLHFENLLGLLGHNELSNYVNQIVDLVGSDATEQQCETACLEVIHSDLLDTACPLICTSFQALVQKLHIDATQAPAKRFLLDSLHFENLLGLLGHNELSNYVNQIVDLVGSDATEQQCETACLEVMHSDLLDTACPLICTSFQALVQKLHIYATSAPAKRFLLDSLHFENLLGLLGHNELSNYVNQIVDLVGSDATEQQCETACLEVMHSDLLDTACPLICTSFQALVQKLHIDATSAPAKRFLLDGLNFGNLLSLMGNDDLNKYVNQIVELVGSDATEQQCETACLEVMHSDLLDTACPLICTSFQSLVQKFHVDTNGGVHGPAKRFLLDSLHFENLLGLLGHNELSNYVNQIVDLVGSDATEQQCETACLEVIHSDLLDSACPLICTSFQALVQKLHIDATQAPAKRFLLDSLHFENLLGLLGHNELSNYVNQIVDLVGSDATEQQCETACLEVMHSDLLDTACPLICTSFQALVQKLHIDATAAPAKRFLMDSLNFGNLLGMMGNAELNKYVNQIVDLTGSDATEQQCETACLEVMHSDLLDTACPLICTSFQTLVQKFHIEATAQAPAKRFLMDGLHFDNLVNLFGHTELVKYINLIVDKVGSDATEQQCETACIEVVHNDLLDTGCPLICSSFQALAQKLHIN